MSALMTYKDFCRRNINVVLEAVFLILWLTTVKLCRADNIFVPSGEELYCNIPQEWSEIEDLEQRKLPIQLMVTALKSNYQKIATFKGNFALTSALRYDRSLLNSDGSFDIVFESDPLWHREFRTVIVSDQACNKVYRNVKVTDSYFEYEGKRFQQNPETLTGTVSIDTADEYVYLQNGNLYQGVDRELPGHPNIPIDNVAWVEQPEYNDNKSYVDNIDPFRYYDMKYWSSLDMILDVIDGKVWKEQQKIVNDAIRVFETTDEEGVKWFRYQQTLADHSEVNILWHEKSSFLPVYSVLCNESRITDTSLQVKWNEIAGVFVPVEILSVMNSSNGELRTRNQTSITDIHINEPIDENQFSYAALGLQGESFIMNQIQKKVYKLKDGKAVFFSDYNTKQDDTRQHLKISKTRILFVISGLVLIFGGLFLRRGKANAK